MPAVTLPLHRGDRDITARWHDIPARSLDVAMTTHRLGLSRRLHGSQGSSPGAVGRSLFLAGASVAAAIVCCPASGPAAPMPPIEQAAVSKDGALAGENTLPARDQDQPAEIIATVGPGWG